jgi:sialate O-acetylesterase
VKVSRRITLEVPMLSFFARQWRLLLPILLLPIVAGAAPASANVSLPHIYSNHMVFQQNEPLPLRGMASPKESVSVLMAGPGEKVKRGNVTAGPDGAWSVILPAHKAGGPYKITVSGKNIIVLEDVLIGEVWVCSGQSNMAMILADAKDAPTEIAVANYPQLRLFASNFAVRATPQGDVTAGRWKKCTPENANQFSALGYLFGRDLQQALKVPVGIVVSAAGGTVIESWVNQPGITMEPSSTSLRDEYQRQVANLPGAIEDAGWQAPEYVDAAWKSMTVPGAWEASGQGLDNLDGAVWFRREVIIPDAWAGKPLLLNFSAIDDGDVTYFNGLQVGAMNVDTPLVWKLARQYVVPASAVKAGRAVIATRITDQLGAGGFVGKPEEMWLGLASHPEDKLPLDGAWKYKVAEKWPTTNLPTGLYNGMVAPWTALPIAGVAWYQGESNASNAASYRQLLPKLIQGWRAAWKQNSLSFLVVQLPGYGVDGPLPAESAWAALREAQAQSAIEIPHVGLAVTLDLGEVDNIHPKNKQGVAQRLAQLALARVYNREIVATGPVCDAAHIEGNAVLLHFKNADKGLVLRGEELKGFAIAGADRQFVWGRASITGQSIRVQSDQVPAPLYVRYGWANSPVSSLYNAAGLPAAPFRTEKETVIPGD